MIEMVGSVFSGSATAVHVATTPFLASFGSIAALVIGHAFDNSKLVKEEPVTASTRGDGEKGGRR